MSVLRDNVNGGPEALRTLLQGPIVAAPGVFNGVSALLAQRAGFRALYLSGSGVAGAAGLPDLSLTTLSEVAHAVREIVAVSRLPLIVDADTGFGEALNVVRTVRELESAGAAAVHLEDQVLPKKCGHLAGKELVSSDEMVEKVRAAAEARKDPAFTIIARTDARAVEGFDAAVRRAQLYLDAGADAIFPEALQSAEEFGRFPQEVSAPLLANMTEFGKSPLLGVDELGRLGYRIVIFPLTAFRASLRAVERTYERLHREGTQAHFVDDLMTREQFYDLIGYREYESEDLGLAKRAAAPPKKESPRPRK